MNSPVELPQLTVKAVVLGILLSMILAGANAYLGLFAGMTVSASIPAAVISMGVLRLFKNSNILENNIVQTSASAGESIAAGVIFTMPALIILNASDFFSYWWVSAIAGCGGLLGVLYTIPLRRSLIIEEKLAFPEGVATAEVLQVGDTGSGLRYLAVAGLLGGLAKLSSTGLKLWSETAQAGAFLGGKTIAYAGINLSPALLSVGYIVGVNIAVLVFVGGAISWYLAIPIYSTFFMESNAEILAAFQSGMPAEDLAGLIWTRQIRYLGVGAMLVGGIWALISMRKALFSGIMSGLKTVASVSGQEVHHTEKDVPMKLVFILVAVMVIPIFVLYQMVVADSGGFAVSIPMTLVMIVAAFLFSSVAAYMAGLVGSSNNPISGVTIATILFAALMLLWLMGPEAEMGPVAAIMIGGVVCCAAAIGGDNMQDLKAGYILGATPWKQQVMQGVGVISAVLVMFPILNLLNQAYGIGVATPEHPNPLQAPQATLMASVAQGVFRGGLPWAMVGIGAAIGVAIIVIDEWAKSTGKTWRAPVLAVAVGIYLPLELSVPVGLGGLISYLAQRWHQRNESVDGGSMSMRNGMLFAAGLITGEALIGIFMALPIVISGSSDVLALAAQPFHGKPGLLALGILAYMLYRIARDKNSTDDISGTTPTGGAQ
jgi:putative OPT family oligopeptide transporter